MDSIDSRLAFRSSHCDGDHYLVGNPHTFPGRLAMWCEVSSCELSVSLSEISRASEHARVWIEPVEHFGQQANGKWANSEDAGDTRDGLLCP